MIQVGKFNQTESDEKVWDTAGPLETEDVVVNSLRDSQDEFDGKCLFKEWIEI